MRIGIIGSRGIPNRYGGFEELAEHLSQQLVENGNEVFVYSTHDHPFQGKNWREATIVHCYNPEKILGSAGQFIYDLNSILDARKRRLDIIIQLGYTSSAIWNWLLPKRAKLLSNMDGLEWKRAKYSSRVQSFLRWSEKLVAERSDLLIADSKAIAQYLRSKYPTSIDFIPYGANIPTSFDSNELVEFGLKEKQYDLLIARFEPENNLEMILDAYSNRKEILVLIGNSNNEFGSRLITRYKSKNILFLGKIYKNQIVNSLRHYSRLYLHGHSAGGTNPSLLQAMACSCNILSHDNPFNREVLENAYFFENKTAISNLLDSFEELSFSPSINLNKIKSDYQWVAICSAYENAISKAIEG